jgi:hypothetical protein
MFWSGGYDALQQEGKGGGGGSGWGCLEWIAAFEGDSYRGAGSVNHEARSPALLDEGGG